MSEKILFYCNASFPAEIPVEKERSSTMRAPLSNPTYAISSSGNKLIIKNETLLEAVRLAGKNIRNKTAPIQIIIHNAAEHFGLPTDTLAQALSFKKHVENPRKKDLESRIITAIKILDNFRRKGTWPREYRGGPANQDVILPPILELEAKEAIRNHTQHETSARLLLAALEAAQEKNLASRELETSPRKEVEIN